MDKISGTLVYVCIPKPVKAMEKAGVKKPDEWKASVVVDEDTADAFEEYGTQCKTMISCKKVKTAEFENKYKCKPPEGAGKNVWVITFRKSTELGKTGNPVPDQYKPKVFEKIGKNVVEITSTKLVGNGSKGTISIDPFTRTDGSVTLYLKNVLVTDLVEYVPVDRDTGPAGSEFNDDDDDTPASPTASTAASTPKQRAKPSVTDTDDDIPF